MRDGGPAQQMAEKMKVLERENRELSQVPKLLEISLAGPAEMVSAEVYSASRSFLTAAIWRCS